MLMNRFLTGNYLRVGGRVGIRNPRAFSQHLGYSRDMSVRLNKPWRPLQADLVAGLPGQLGVFEFADEHHAVIFIGRADARSRFGLRSAIAEAHATIPMARSFRVEITAAYHTRHLELLMAHQADHGALPVCNPPMPSLGRLTLDKPDAPGVAP
jgi:hypothetical protein